MLLFESIVQLGYRLGVREGTKPGAGVFGGEKSLPRGLSRYTSFSISSGRWQKGFIPVISKSFGSATGSSMLGMGTSAAATDARNCWVGAESWETTRLFSLRRGFGARGIAVSSSSWANGSGVLGASYPENLKPRGRVWAPECWLIVSWNVAKLRNA